MTESIVNIEPIQGVNTTIRERVEAPPSPDPVTCMLVIRPSYNAQRRPLELQCCQSLSPPTAQPEKEHTFTTGPPVRLPPSVSSAKDIAARHWTSFPALPPASTYGFIHRRLSS
ncbi:hypothetical protein N7462_005097 [Penicillium macrosclerotiorum]|uniref:uncharacterized protein n=1 Tax=Penicillium macrosclerotiorum TaxID=303699 RepID=UPI002546E18E|nr:uncharacterized protein N7462_005097 [Penicillium macrosclerotiorum]KAJ5690705.1 hypothetical protein N7462_005097 [Penicillium macrosclerotiorum]